MGPRQRIVLKLLLACGSLCLAEIPQGAARTTAVAAAPPAPRVKAKKKPATTRPSGKRTRGRRGGKRPAPEQTEAERLRRLAKFKEDQGACAQGDLQACLRVADAYNAAQNSHSVAPTDPERANGLYRRVCAGGIAQGCFVLAVNTERGRGVSYEHAAVVTTHRKGCELGKDASCTRLATIFLEGRGQEPDVTAGLELLEARCQVRGSACTELANIYEDGIFVPQDLTRVLQLVSEMCDKGFVLACQRLAKMYREGVGVTADLARSDALLKLGCEQGNTWGCTLYDRHQERHQRLASAKTPAPLCEQGDLNACVEAGRGMRTLVEQAATGKWAPFPGLYERGLAYLQRACDGGLMSGCAELSEAYLWGLGVSVDADRGLALADAACRAGEPKGCAGMGLALVVGHGVKSQPKKGAGLLENTCGGGRHRACGSSSVKALRASLKKRCYHLDLEHRGCEMLRLLDTRECEGGTPRECAALGETHASARGGTFHPQTAMTLLTRACEGDHLGGCVQLAWAQLTQRDFPRDDARSIGSLKVACEAGSRTGCIRLAMAYRLGLGMSRDDRGAGALWTRACEEAPSHEFVCKGAAEGLKGHFLATCRNGLSHRGCQLWRGPR